MTVLLKVIGIVKNSRECTMHSRLPLYPYVTDLRS